MQNGGNRSRKRTSGTGDIILNTAALAEAFATILGLAKAPVQAQVEAFKSTDAFARYAGLRGKKAHGETRALAKGFEAWCQEMQIELPQSRSKPKPTRSAADVARHIPDPAAMLEYYVAQEAAFDPDVLRARRALDAVQATGAWDVYSGDGLRSFLQAASKWELCRLLATQPESKPNYVDDVEHAAVMAEANLETHHLHALLEARAILQAEDGPSEEKWCTWACTLAVPSPGDTAEGRPFAVLSYDENGITRQLLEIAAAVHSRFRWDWRQVLGYIVFGHVPSIGGLNEARASTYPLQLRALARIVLEIDPRVSPAEVRKAYEIERQKLLKNDRAKSPKHSLLGFFWGLPSTQALPTRAAQVEAWNRFAAEFDSPADYAYANTPQGQSNLARDARAARLSILHFGKPPEKGSEE